MTKGKFTASKIINTSGQIAAAAFWISLFIWLLFVVWDSDFKVDTFHISLQWAITALLVWMLLLLIESVLLKTPPDESATPATPATPETTLAYAYPHGKTTVTLKYIILFTVAFLVLTILGLSDQFDSNSFKTLPWLASFTRGNREVLVVIVTAGLGSSLATILAFIRHAIYEKDFADRFMPWYLLRPLMGALLGVIFYFLITGGLLALTEVPEGSSLDLHTLAGMATLVGFFSRPAIDKLKVVFDAMFSSTGPNNAASNEQAQKDALAVRDATYSTLKAEITAGADPAKLKTLEEVWKRISNEQWTIGSGDEPALMAKLKAMLNSKMTDPEKAILNF